MAKYLIQFTYSPASRAGLVANPQDRRPALSKVFEAAGGAVEDFWFSFGSWDGVIVADFTGETDTAAAAMAVGATGAFDQVSITQLIPHEEGVRAMQIAHKITGDYATPSAA